METSTTAAECSSTTQPDNGGSNLRLQSSVSLVPSAAGYTDAVRRNCKSEDNTVLKADGQERFYTRNLKLSSFHESRAVVGQPSDGNKVLLISGLVCL